MSRQWAQDTPLRTVRQAELENTLCRCVTSWCAAAAAPFLMYLFPHLVSVCFVQCYVSVTSQQSCGKGRQASGARQNLGETREHAGTWREMKATFVSEKAAPVGVPETVW